MKRAAGGGTEGISETVKPPSVDDKIVAVRAWLTDEAFGYEHWRAAQFSAPQFECHGALVLFDTEAERDDWIRTHGGEG